MCGDLYAFNRAINRNLCEKCGMGALYKERERILLQNSKTKCKNGCCGKGRYVI
jgi:hypothetical protein